MSIRDGYSALPSRFSASKQGSGGEVNCDRGEVLNDSGQRPAPICRVPSEPPGAARVGPLPQAWRSNRPRRARWLRSAQPCSDPTGPVRPERREPPRSPPAITPEGGHRNTLSARPRSRLGGTLPKGRSRPERINPSPEDSPIPDRVTCQSPRDRRSSVVTRLSFLPRRRFHPRPGAGRHLFALLRLRLAGAIRALRWKRPTPVSSDRRQSSAREC